MGYHPEIEPPSQRYCPAFGGSAYCNPEASDYMQVCTFCGNPFYPTPPVWNPPWWQFWRSPLLRPASHLPPPYVPQLHNYQMYEAGHAYLGYPAETSEWFVPHYNGAQGWRVPEKSQPWGRFTWG